ncbi:MAG: hypothetical protein IJW23_09705 [Lentisphaeria bacterium]|nr:hypothetical protein [Lentisphaeria bacterium]
MQTWLLQLIELLKRAHTISRTLEELLEENSFEESSPFSVELTDIDKMN